MESLREVADRLVELCDRGQWGEAMQELYDADVVSVEADTFPGMSTRQMHGLDAHLKAGADWADSHTIHSSTVKGPYLFQPDRFAVCMSMDVTPTRGPMADQRMLMDEVCVYTVAGGKITRAEFFWTMP